MLTTSGGPARGPQTTRRGPAAWADRSQPIDTGRIEQPCRSQHRELVDKALVRLNLNFASPQRLEDLAADVGVSVFHLCRIFRRQTGITIGRYRRELRLEQARTLLADSKDDILTIAVLLGYSGHSHFTGVFRHRFGVTPSAYRHALRDLARVPDGASVPAGAPGFSVDQAKARSA